MRRDAPALVLTRAAEGHRRRLSTSAWVVLECLATEAVDRDGQVTTTVRELGGRVGLNKDTVTRALQVLTDAGLVTRLDLRGASGRFGSSSYRVELASAGFGSPCPNRSDVASTATATAPTAPSTSSSSDDTTTDPEHDIVRTAPRPDVDPNQLSLIEP